MSRYTPGPLSVDLDVSEDGPVVARKDGKIIAQFYGRRDVAEANARLYAAAPEMLEALLNVVKQAESNPFLAIGMLLEHHSEIRAVIAKAEGRE